MSRFRVLLLALLTAHAGALSRLKLRHSVPYLLTSSDMVRIQRSLSDGSNDASSIENLEIKEFTKRSEKSTLSRISLKTETREMNINLQPMKTIMAPDLRVTVIDGKRKRMQENEVHKSLKDSFFYGEIEGVEDGVASLMRDVEGWKGLVFTDGEAFAVNHELDTGNHVLMKMINEEFSDTHPVVEDVKQKKRHAKNEEKNDSGRKEEKGGLKMEVGVYIDEALYEYVEARYNYEDTIKHLQALAILTINTIDIYYHKPSLDSPIEVVVAKLVIHRSDPKELGVDEDISKYLNNFCEWEAKYKNPRGLHYDVALLLTGLDLYTTVGDFQDTAVTGVAPFAGACKQYAASSCVISEALELSLAIVSAHEFGHGVGMEHDGDKNNCPKAEFIMGSILSPGATKFSSCSKDALNTYIQELDEFNSNCLRKSVSERTLDFEDDQLPGERLADDEQCFYAMGSLWFDAIEDEKYCSVLKCRSLFKIGIPYGGPPLPGSRCGDDKLCLDGKCQDKSVVKEIIKKNKQRTSPPPRDPLSLDQLCEKYTGEPGYTVGAAYNKGLSESSGDLRGFCEKGLICMLPDESTAYRFWNYPVPPGTPCGEGQVCKHFRCEDIDSPEPPMDSTDVTEVVDGNSDKDKEKPKDKVKPAEPKIPSETRDAVAEFCKTYISSDSVPKPTGDCTLVVCEDAKYYYSVPAYKFNMCPKDQICNFEGQCVADPGKPLEGELTEEELEIANENCENEYGEQFQSFCVREALSFSLKAAALCSSGLCGDIACFAFFTNKTYSINAYEASYGDPCGKDKTCKIFGCGTLV